MTIPSRPPSADGAQAPAAARFVHLKVHSAYSLLEGALPIGKLAKLAADTEAFCQEIRPAEELCYAERRFNEQLLPLAKKYDLLGINVKPEYGGRGADNLSYFKALARIGREGTGVRTFFSGHLSIGAYPIQTYGGDAVKKKYLPAAVRGESILAFGLTEPDAGSNPREMTTTFEKKGDRYILNGVKYLISNGGIAHAIVVFGYPAGVPEGDPNRRISASCSGRIIPVAARLPSIPS